MLSETGVHQGDLGGPLGFALPLAVATRQATEGIPLHVQVWFFDDGCLGGRVGDVAEVFDRVAVTAAAIGMRVDVAKCELIVGAAGEAHARSLFPAGIAAAASSPGGAAELYATTKAAKYAVVAAAAGIAVTPFVTPFVVDAFGAINAEALLLLSRLGAAWGAQRDVHRSRSVPLVASAVVGWPAFSWRTRRVAT
jgi:hypothetical protein